MFGSGLLPAATLSGWRDWNPRPLRPKEDRRVWECRSESIEGLLTSPNIPRRAREVCGRRKAVAPTIGSRGSAPEGGEAS